MMRRLSCSVNVSFNSVLSLILRFSYSTVGYVYQHNVICLKVSTRLVFNQHDAVKLTATNLSLILNHVIN
ncbi:hypothetical protein VCR4J5_1510064 [Vibrio crassostreae]|uniref:Secreted protein n=1 Tax=Vibrio crassostreae TaxID=246167 RepID=A0ABM9QPJ3_9VIBR|nr:hypothetical protein VCR19J5_1210404 [Vibrio crassostreae]CDT11363.1 hypothetical protein VCR4J5_1510064 [Vibrio crassostreae]